MSSGSTSDPLHTHWPDTDLEHVDRCPVCMGKDCEPLHHGLTDDAFCVAPGRWQMWRCLRCRAGYLSPRPTPSSIMRAYSTYYTHSSTAPFAPARDWRARLENGYINARYGGRKTPSSRLGPWVFRLLGIRRSAIDRTYRHLPRPSGPARLLDVGCGDGAFLTVARECGWLASGVEPDPVAAGMARRAGFEVHAGSVETLAGQSGTFDAITLSHVIEHVHEPVRTLRTCLELLRPGGWIWIETPNLDSEGHRIYGGHWRGLEPPRHLVMFDRAALEQALLSAGFVGIRDEAVPSSREAMFRQSEAIRLGQHPGLTDSSLPRLPPDASRACRHAHLAERWLGWSREFLTCSAQRPE